MTNLISKNSSKLKPVVTLMGPTASGKTNLAFSLCDHYPFEIISVDSAMIYKDMDIGSAKPTEKELEKYPHHLINIISPEQTFSVSDFLNQVEVVINQIHQRNKIPLLVGGTMMYFNAFVHGLTELPQANDEIRKNIIHQAKLIGWDKLHQKLSEIDPESAEKIKPNDTQRIQRALEVFEITQKPMSLLWKEQALNALSEKYKTIQLALLPNDRQKLHDLIGKRFYQMLLQGFLKEAESLFQKYSLNESMPSMRCVGYRQAWQFFKEELSYEEMIEKSIVATRQLGKRQITWLRHWKSDFFSLDPFNCDIQRKLFHHLDQQLGIL